MANIHYGGKNRTCSRGPTNGQNSLWGRNRPCSKLPELGINGGFSENRDDLKKELGETLRRSLCGRGGDDRGTEGEDRVAQKKRTNTFPCRWRVAKKDLGGSCPPSRSTVI